MLLHYKKPEIWQRRKKAYRENFNVDSNLNLLHALLLTRTCECSGEVYAVESGRRLRSLS